MKNPKGGCFENVLIILKFQDQKSLYANTPIIILSRDLYENIIFDYTLYTRILELAISAW